MATFQLKEVGANNTKALGFTHELVLDINSQLGTGTGNQDHTLQVGSATMTGIIESAAILVEELVTDTADSGQITDFTAALGDNADQDGFVAATDIFSDSGNLNKLFSKNGDILKASPFAHALASGDDMILRTNATGDGADGADSGRIRILVRYIPDAGVNFSG